MPFRSPPAPGGDDAAMRREAMALPPPGIAAAAVRHGPAEEPLAQQRRAAAPEASVWVSASAGTGKTRVLTDRLLRLLLDGTDPARILCLTFTRAAAAEMANRLNEELARWATAPAGELTGILGRLTGRYPDEIKQARARQLLARVLDTPGGIKIGTIHSFCQSLLRRFPSKPACRRNSRSSTSAARRRRSAR